MAGARELSSRMSRENQNIDDKLIYETVFNHFKRHKVEISRAIKKAFPFLEVLRDRELITNKMYQDCQDSCRNLVPVPKVVYHVLDELQSTFDVTLLEALFSEVNMQEYPDLSYIYKSFEKVIQEKLNCEERDQEERQERPNIQLRLEQGSGESSYQSLIWSCRESSSYDGTTPSENRFLEHLRGTAQINAKRKDTTSDQNDALESQQANEQCAQESEPAGANLPNHGIQINSCSVCLVDIKKEKPFFISEVKWKAQASTKCNQTSDIIVISSEDSAESSDGDETPEASISAQRIPVIDSSADEATFGSYSSALRCGPDDEDSSDFENTFIYGISNRKRRFSGVDTSELSNKEPREASSSVLRNGSDTMDTRSNSTLEKDSGTRMRKRGRRRVQTLSNRAPKKRGKPRGRKTINSGPLKRGRRRGSKIPKEANMDFRLPELPVTCGEVEGILNKEKMKKGVSEKCVQSKDGRRFTLREFEVEGNRAASKNWKMSVRCGGWPLKYLIEKGFLPDPSIKR
ncbi:nuclear autoantigen Sp-100 isoform X3 [Camelus bactrianus]|uniref:nuclear autoantigen Sp-100 isoform X3 n=1 Tax=Camelus bactrianus TaxID=9837 RepID=UPI003D6F8975